MTYRDSAREPDPIGMLEELEGFYADILEKEEAVDRIRRHYPRQFEMLRVLKATFPGDPGLCRTCGLPKNDDIDHDPPECPNPKSAPVEAFQPYYAEQRKRFTAALERRSNAELVGLGIPTSRAFSLYLKTFVEKRLEALRAEAALARKNAPNRLDFINDDAE